MPCITPGFCPASLASLQGLDPHHLHHVRGFLPCITCIMSGACTASLASLKGHAPHHLHHFRGRGLPRQLCIGACPASLRGLPQHICTWLCSKITVIIIEVLKMKSFATRRHVFRRFAKKIRDRRKKISAQIASLDDRSWYVLWTLQVSMLISPHTPTTVL